MNNVTGKKRADHQSTGRSGLRQAARMEWIKLRTLRSTWWTLAITLAGTVGIGVAVGVHTENAAGDLTNNALAGIAPGLLLVGVLGVLTMTGEYGSGTIRSTLLAVPRRPLMLAAKAAMFGSVMLVVGEVAALISFLAGNLALRHGIVVPSLTQPGVLRAVILAGVSYSLIGLIGLGLGAVIRHSAAAIAVLVGGVYVAGQFVGLIAHSAAAYMPVLIVGNSLTVTKPPSCGGNSAVCVPFLSPWAGLAVLCGYAAVTLVAGGWLLVRRDA